MTWTDVIATGSGEADFRLVIEGAKYQFVETPLMRGYTYQASILPAAGSEAWAGVGATPGTVTTGQADPYGGTNASLLTDDRADATEALRTATAAYTSGSPVRVELMVKADYSPTAFAGIRLPTDSSEVVLNLATGAAQVLTGSAITNISVTEPVDGWWRVRFDHSGEVAATTAVRVHPARGTTYPTAAAAATGSVTVYGPSIRLRDGRKRVPGLQREGMMFTETAYLAGAELNVSIAPVRITETPEPDLNCATEIFSKIPRTQAWLASSVATAATSASTLDATDIDVGGFYHVGTETIRVVAKSGADLTTIDRGQWGTTAQAHNVTNATSAETQQVPLIDGVEVWTKRRWWLYAHGPTELDVTDEGTLVMQGVLAAEPEEAEGEWTISLDSRMALLEQEVAAAVDVVRKLRGIYYPGRAPFRVRVRRSTDTTSANTTAGASSDTYIALSGFWETQADFCAALEDALNNHATVGTWATWSCAEHDGRWELYYTTPAVDPRYLSLGEGSPVDGTFYHRVRYLSTTETRTRGDEDIDVNDTSVSASSRYLCLWQPIAGGTYFATLGAAPEDLRRAPRTMNSVEIVFTADTDAQVTAYPVGRQYLNNVIGVATGDSLLVPQVDEDGQEADPLEIEITATSLSVGYVEAYGDDSIDLPSGIVAAGAAAEAVVLTGARSYTGVAGGDLSDFIDALVLAAPDGANDASTPWLVADDIAQTTWQTVVAEAAAGLAYLARRAYTFSKGQRLEDVIKQECRLYGVFPYLDADFKIAIRRLTVETAEVASGLHVTGTSHIDDERRAEIRSGADGNVNVYELSRGYNQVDDKYTENPVHVVDVAGVSKSKARRVIEVRPKTRAVGEEPTVVDAARMSQPVRAMFGGKIVHVTVDVPLTFWDVHVGDSVLLTDETAPHDGARGLHDPGQGLTSTRAIVVGREWRFDDAAGTLTCLIVGLDAAGYTPTARVSSAAGATDTWTVTVEASRYAPTGENDDTYFTTGDRVRLIEWDSDTPTTVLGEVTAVDTSSHEIDLTLDGAWAGLGGAIYNLTFADYDDTVGISTDQARYAYIASSTRRLDDGATTRNAREFAP